MAGSAQERDGLAGAVRDRADRDGSTASLTAAASRDRGGDGVRLLLGAAGILGLSLIRAMAIRAGLLDILPAAGFALALLAGPLLAPSVRARLRQAPRLRSLGLGAILGTALLVPGGWMRLHGVPGPQSYLSGGYALTWMPLVALIATGEEVALRGWIQPLARQGFGPTAAILVTAVLFAAIHAPIYGWIALPLDLGAGILFGCLREYTRSVAACAVAHFLVDAGHWWLP